jgi:hypothetical protein|tara:strand:+ start:2502 stop:2699 length:198 start_codon:yes stop_codon:yes gene_type:complete
VKYIDYIKTRIKTLADPKLLEFPESDEMIQRKIVTEQRRQKRKKIHTAKRKGRIDHRTNRPGKAK